MVRSIHWMLPLGAMLAAGGCGGPEPEAGGGEPAAEERDAQPPEVVRGYAPDSLAWLQEGRAVLFEGREWRPIGQPFSERPEAFRRVGEFEGMALYAAAGDGPPYDLLFFPLGNDVWQPLEPGGGALSGGEPPPER